MSDLRRISGLAVVLIVLLRLSIGWQFLYEGLWKLDTQDSSQPWTAEGYLKNARGPFRDSFVSMGGGDPHDLNWLDYDWVSARWNYYADRYVRHYPNLTDRQRGRLREMIDGKREHVAELAKLPEGVQLPKKLSEGKSFVVRFDAKRKLLVVNGAQHMLPAERDQLYALVPDVSKKSGKYVGGTAGERAFYEAVDKAYQRQGRLSYKERLAGLLRGDDERVGHILDRPKGVNVYTEFGDFKRFGQIDKYRTLVASYERDLDEMDLPFREDHLDYTLAQIRNLKGSLVGPVKALDAELQTEARGLLTDEQLRAGKVPPPRDAVNFSNQAAIWSLIILGVMLIIGLGTRGAAILGAGMLLTFYLVMPPWPGVPEAPGPEHSLIVNKNLIEAIALFAVAAMPTGVWFGIDGLIRRLWLSRRNKTKPKKVEQKPETVPQAEKITSPSDAPWKLSPK